MLEPLANDDVSAQFRQAMRRLAATVTVITTGDHDHPFGMTASAVTSLAMQPPSLLICVNKSTLFHQAITTHERFCVNILTTGHDDISAAFGGARLMEDRFHVGEWVFDHDVPYLQDAQANIFCRRANLFEHGTHTIVVGDVTKLRLRDPVAPLLYVDGGYASAVKHS